MGNQIDATDWFRYPDEPYYRGDAPDGPPIAQDIPQFADRTHLVTADALGGGDGSEVNPWTLEEALSQAVAGDIVGIQQGLYVGSGTTSRFTPAFRPTNSGTAISPIVFVAENQASLVTAGYTELRSGATVAGSGWPAFGALTKDHIHWVGIFSDESAVDNKGTADSGPCTMWTGTGYRVQGCKIRGIAAPFTDNHSGIRLEFVSSGLFSDNDIANFNSQVGGGGTNQAGILTYEMQDTTIEYNKISNCGDDLYIKGREQWNNIIRFNWLETATIAAMRLTALIPSPTNQRNQIYQNVIYDCVNDIEVGLSATLPAPDAMDGVDIFNNSIYIQSGSSSSFGLFLTDSPEQHDNTLNNNVFYVIGRKAVFGTEISSYDAQDFTDYIDSNNNCFFGATSLGDGTSGSNWNQVDLATWQSLTTADADSQWADPLFVDPNNGDLKLQAGSPCLNAGADYRQLLGGLVTAPINQGAYVSSDQSEVIGIRGT